MKHSRSHAALGHAPSFVQSYFTIIPIDLDSSNRRIKDYVQETSIPKLDEDSGNSLDGPFLYEELLDAITNTPSDKSPGPEGFTLKFYKTFKEHLTQFMLSVQ